MENPQTEKARQIIAANRYLSMATCHSENPWVAPLAYVVDHQYRFYFYSAISSIHAQHIKGNPQVAVAIFNSTEPSDIVDGLQIAATCTEVEPADLPRVMDLYFKQSFPDERERAQWIRPTEDFLGEAIQRFYCITPNRVYKIDPTSTKVDRRLEINLKELASHPAK